MKNKEFYTALEILIERYKSELGYITREIEKNEKERTFLLAKRYSYETSLKYLGTELQCLKDSGQQSKQ
jgi:hypothetical protein